MPHQSAGDKHSPEGLRVPSFPSDTAVAESVASPGMAPGDDYFGKACSTYRLRLPSISARRCRSPRAMRGMNSQASTPCEVRSHVATIRVPLPSGLRTKSKTPSHPCPASRPRGPRCYIIRASAILLLYASHSVDSCAGASGLENTAGIRQPMVVRKSPDGKSRASRGIPLEPPPSLSGVGRRHRDPPRSFA